MQFRLVVASADTLYHREHLGDDSHPFPDAAVSRPAFGRQGTALGACYLRSQPLERGQPLTDLRDAFGAAANLDLDPSMPRLRPHERLREAMFGGEPDRCVPLLKRPGHFATELVDDPGSEVCPHEAVGLAKRLGEFERLPRALH